MANSTGFRTTVYLSEADIRRLAALQSRYFAREKKPISRSQLISIAVLGLWSDRDNLPRISRVKTENA